MSNEITHDDDALIDTDDMYTDGDDLTWSIVSVNLIEQTVTLKCITTPVRTVPASALEQMKRSLFGEPEENLVSGVVVGGMGGLYSDQDDLHWKVKAVNLRDRTVSIKLLNPPRRTISVEQLRKMRSQQRETEKLRRRMSRDLETLSRRDD